MNTHNGQVHLRSRGELHGRSPPWGEGTSIFRLYLVQLLGFFSLVVRILQEPVVDDRWNRTDGNERILLKCVLPIIWLKGFLIYATVTKLKLLSLICRTPGVGAQFFFFFFFFFFLGGGGTGVHHYERSKPGASQILTQEHVITD